MPRMPKHIKTRLHRRRGYLDPALFTLAMQRLRPRRGLLRGYEGARLVLCEGRTMPAAAKIAGTTKQNVHICVRRIEEAYESLNVCPYCGGKLQSS